MLTTFAERLRDQRRAAGLSQTELAGDGISPSYVSLLESGRRRPSPGVAALLAAKLGCSTSELLDGEPSERDRRVQLEIAYAELTLRHDGAAEAASRLGTLLDEPELSSADRLEATLLLARARERSGDLNGAIALLLPIFEEAAASGQLATLPRVAIHLCHCYKATGDFNRAVRVGEQALDACRRQNLEGADDYYRLAATVMSAHAEMGDESHALSWARNLIDSAEASGSRGGQGALYWNASVLAEHEGRIDEALYLSRKALAHFSELGDERDLARLKVASSEVLLAADAPLVDEAREALDRAHEQLGRLGSQLDLVEWEHLRSTVALLDRDLVQAEHLALSAIRRLPESAGSEQLALAHRALGDALVAKGERQRAVEHYAIAADLLELTATGRAGALLWRDLAERLLSIGEVDRAVQALRGSLTVAGVRNRAGAVVARMLDAEAGADRDTTSAEALEDSLSMHSVVPEVG
jgi:transcriptional regulator with XRE-family HTH domain